MTSRAWLSSYRSSGLALGSKPRNDRRLQDSGSPLATSSCTGLNSKLSGTRRPSARPCAPSRRAPPSSSPGPTRSARGWTLCWSIAHTWPASRSSAHRCAACSPSTPRQRTNATPPHSNCGGTTAMCASRRASGAAPRAAQLWSSTPPHKVLCCGSAMSSASGAPRSALARWPSDFRLQSGTCARWKRLCRCRLTWWSRTSVAPTLPTSCRSPRPGGSP
mmetsp:Transcript_165787/g.532384  ORF Transcript_165787/g.532384 Transcript_165787/m.532384 type:complete len:219 (+) Transcript_165787:1149-1805(+)